MTLTHTHRFIASILAVILMGCMKKPALEYVQNDIDLNPILSLNIPVETDNIEKVINVVALEKLSQVSFPSYAKTLRTNDLDFLYHADSPEGSQVTISVEIFLHNDITLAARRVRDSCDDNFNGRSLSSSNYGSVNGVPYFYCVYDLKLLRSDASSFRIPTGRYNGYAFIQKGNMDIVIEEYTETLDRTFINQAIETIATTISPPSP